MVAKNMLHGQYPPVELVLYSWYLRGSTVPSNAPYARYETSVLRPMYDYPVVIIYGLSNRTLDT